MAVCQFCTKEIVTKKPNEKSKVIGDRGKMSLPDGFAHVHCWIWWAMHDSEQRAQEQKQMRGELGYYIADWFQVERHYWRQDPNTESDYYEILSSEDMTNIEKHHSVV